MMTVVSATTLTTTWMRSGGGCVQRGWPLLLSQSAAASCIARSPGRRQQRRLCSSSSVLGIPPDELKDMREHLRAFGRSHNEENSVTLQDAATAMLPSSSQESPPSPHQEALPLDPGVAKMLTLNNPKSRNALTGKMMAELADCVDDLEQDYEQLTAVVVRGNGHFFCAGADIGIAKEHLLTPEGGRIMSTVMIDTLTRLRNLPVVTVAVVEGMAIGGGAELATAMDYRIVTPDATIRFVHARMGVSPGWGGATRLTRLVGRRRALQLLGTTQPLNASQALEYGLVDAIVDAESTTDETVVQFLDRYVHAHPGVLHAAKRVVAGSDDAASFEEAVRNEHNVFCSMWGGEANLVAMEKASSSRSKQKK